MPFNTMEMVFIPFNGKVEPPVLRYSGLPQAAAFVVLFGTQRRMAKVACQKMKLFIKGFLNQFRSSF